LELRPSLQRPVELDPVLTQRVRKRDPLTVPPLPKLVLVVHRPRSRGRPEQRTPEPRPLLVRPVHEPDRHRRLALLGQPPHDLDPRDDVQRPVEPAAVWDRVDVPADQDGPLGPSAERPPLIPGRVDLLLERQAGKLLAQPLARALPRVRPRNPLRAALVPG